MQYICYRLKKILGEIFMKFRNLLKKNAYDGVRDGVLQEKKVFRQNKNIEKVAPLPFNMTTSVDFM